MNAPAVPEPTFRELSDRMVERCKATLASVDRLEHLLSGELELIATNTAPRHEADVTP